MSNQDKEERGSSHKSEFPDSIDMEPDEGVDAEMDDDVHEEAGGNQSLGTLQQSQAVSHSSSSKDMSGESPRKRKDSAERRRKHHHHHSSSSSSSSHNHNRRRRSGGHSGEDGEAAEDGGRSRKRSDSAGDDHHPSNSTSSSSSRSSHRKNRDRRSSRSQRSRHHPDSGNDEWPQQESRGGEATASSHSKKMDREKKVEIEAEDGEILEDGELDDDGGNDDANVPQEESRLSLDTSHEDTEESPGKSYGKDEGKSQKRDKKKPEHRDKRRKEDDKKKRKKYVDMDKISDEESGPAPAPAWGSGYQGARQKSSPLRGSSYGKSSKNSRGKGYQSPPGLYDSPSYSEESDSEEQYPRCLDMLSGGYLDASVAADEKEGIFKRGMTFKKKKRMDRNQSGKRRMQDFNKADGPPKKKALVDLAMSDRPKCKFYRDGKCAKGSGCPFNHDMEQSRKMEVCKYHLTVKGCHKERCPYMHEDYPCKYFHTGAQCFSGDRCKFSHDPLTEDTRRALELRVAPEDIIDADDPDYDDDYDYRPRNYESRGRPSLLGSPPRRHEVKKIPSLFDIEVHPPTPSPKPSPSSVRPTGFYNEAECSPPSSGSNAGSSQGPDPNIASSSSNNNNNNGSNNNNNNGMNNSNNNNNMGNKSGGIGPNNQGGPGMLRPNMNNNMSGPGLLQTPSMPPVGGTGPMGPMMGGPTRPPLMGNQPLRPGMPPFMNNGNNNAPPGNLPPVLNVLGAIIREAAMQKVSSASQNMNMSGPGVNNMGGGMNMMPNNMNNMPPPPQGMVQNNMNNLGPNNMQPMGGNNMNMNNMPQGNMNAMGNIGPNNMNRMMQGMNQMGGNNMNQMGSNNMNQMGGNNMNQMGGNNMNQMGPGGMNAMGGNNMNPMMLNNMNSNMPQGKPGDDSVMMRGDMPPPLDNRDGQGPEDMMDVDYRIKQNFDDQDESSKDLSELDSIRRRLQEQINQEDADQEEEEEEEEEEEGEENQRAEQSVSHGDRLAEDNNGLSPDTKETSESSTKQSSKPASDNSLDNIEVPAHLPKKQRELFMRIQQQHLLRERERERQEALKTAEESEKVDKDDWYSSSDEEDEEKAKTSESKEDPLKSSSEPQSTSEASSSSTKAAATPAPSTFNIMQMINAIRNQGSLPSSAESKVSGAAGQTVGTSSSQSGHTVETRSPASPPASPDDQMSTVPSFPPPPLGVEPPVVSAMPTKPLKYAIVRIALNMPKTYTFLPSSMDALEPRYRFDPRVKRHLQLVDKQPQPLPPPPPKEKEVRRPSAESTEKSAKPVDPRLKRAPADPRLTKTGGSSPGSDGRPMDPRLKKDAAPSRPVDPRLAKRAANPPNDPRLNRQISQDSGNQMVASQMNNMGGPLGGNNSMGNMNSMGGPMNNMGGPMGNMGGPMNNMGSPMNTMGGPMNAMGMNNMGGPMSNMGSPINNMSGPMNSMVNPMNNMGGPMNNMGGPMNNMGVLMNNQMSGAMNNMNGPVRSMAPMNRMGGPMGNPISSMGMPMNNMGVPMTSNMGNNRMPGPMGNNSQGNNMMGQRGPPPFLGGSMNMMAGQRGPSNLMPNQMGGSNERVQGNFPENPSDPRLNQRSVSDPRSNDPRLQHKSQEVQDQGVNRNDPRLAGGGHVSKASKAADHGNDPRVSSNSRRSSELSRKGLDDPSGVRGYSERRSPNLSDISQERDNSSSKTSKGIIEPLPSLSSSASLPPLPSLSPPPSLSSMMPSSSSLSGSQSNSKESTSEAQKPSKKFDYRNDPRFKRVKRTSAGRQSSMEYSSPLGGEGDSQNAQDPAGSLQYNSYNRPDPTVSGSPHRPNAPSPSLPDTLQDFDMPEFPPLSVSEPDLKVKDLFKTIDPTASPFC